MKQILGGKLYEAFKALGIKAECKHKGSKFEVWEISDYDYRKLIEVPDEDWKESYGWWRYGRCIEEKSKLYPFKVNGKEMLGYLDDSLVEGVNKLMAIENASDFILSAEYKSFTEWLSAVWELGNEKNTACFAISLSKENKMTLAEFIKTFQP